MFESQAECKSPKILSCLLRQNVLVWKRVCKIIVPSGRRVWISIGYNRGGRWQESDRRNESASLLTFFCLDLWGCKLSGHSVRSIADQYLYNINQSQPGALLPLYPKHKQREINSFLMELCGKWLSPAFDQRRFGRKRELKYVTCACISRHCGEEPSCVVYLDKGLFLFSFISPRAAYRWPGQSGPGANEKSYGVSPLPFASDTKGNH